MGPKYLGQRGGAARQQGEAERQGGPDQAMPEGGATVRTAHESIAS